MNLPIWLNPQRMLWQQVNHSAQVLDGLSSYWWRRIRKDQLNMNSEFNCVLGQLFDTYTRGQKILRRNAHEPVGFWVPFWAWFFWGYTWYGGSKLLKHYWIMQIDTRLAADAVRRRQTRGIQDRLNDSMRLDIWDSAPRALHYTYI